ncbi:Uncharacterised protein [Acidipropionibacterium jensenii]|uniref:Uncharacterized protein n=1 Tax=Acidipropionibacterium jensenii TaxID=1749 RepID=A0A3S4WYJ0_9ACTN|nr:hypothetical protein [Acidipropionibacterium jensenii]VEI04155.1 Uncharacterised protein [Acidipropionibacterium jensenii]
MSEQSAPATKKPIWKRWWMICIYALVLIMIGASLGGGSDDDTSADATPSQSAAASTQSSAEAKESQLKQMGADPSVASAVAHGASSSAPATDPTTAEPADDPTVTSGGIDQGLASVVCEKYAKKEVAAAGGKWKGHYIAGVVKAVPLQDTFFLSYQGEVTNAAGGETPALLNCTVGGTKDNPEVVLAKIVDDTSR